MNFDFDSVVVGAGVVGLAVARALSRSGRSVIVLEAESSFGQGISSRNSEVIHAGIYYSKDSLKQRLCCQGKRLLKDFCDSRKVNYSLVGKLIVANQKEGVAKLQEILNNGLRNGVMDLRMVYKDELTELEPGLRADQAILSPSTGIVDSHGLMLALLGDINDNGGIVSFQSSFVGARSIKGGYSVTVESGEIIEITCRELINSSGLQAQKLSALVEGVPRKTIPVSRLCKGTYFSLSGKSPFSRLIYPLPNKAGLGVHLTLDLAGRAKFGPDVEWVNNLNYEVSSQRKDKFVDAIKDYFPGVNSEDLNPDYSGIRPKTVNAGESAQDFIVQFSDQHHLPGYVAMYGIESPGLTAALAIGEYVCDRIEVSG